MFVSEVESKLAAHILGIEKYTKNVRAPPGLTACAAKAGQEAALKHYKKIVVAEARERAQADDLAAKNKLSEQKQWRRQRR